MLEKMSLVMCSICRASLLLPALLSALLSALLPRFDAARPRRRSRPWAQRVLVRASTSGAVVLLLLLASAARPAQATDYNFSGLIKPPGCVGALGVYVCGALSFAAGDTLTVTQATSVTVNGALSLAANALVNAGGSPANLSFITAGTVTVGAGATLNANVTSSAAVSIGANARVGGNIGTVTGAILVGDGVIATGNLSTVTGAITLGAGTSVSGAITTTTGAIVLGANDVVNGPIASLLAGAITLGASSQVGSTVTTAAGAIVIGPGSVVTGLVSTLGVGTITIGAGAIVNSVLCVLTLDQSCVINNGTLPLPTVSTPVANATAASFDCLETGSNVPWSTSARKPLYTKLAGAGFSIDIAALNADGSLVANYAPAGGAARTVRVELFDDSAPPASCSAYLGAVSTQSVTFAPGVFSGAAGRTQSATVTLGKAYQLLRCRVTECTSGMCTSFGAAPSCSSDQFSVRPQAVTLQTSALAPAPSPTAIPAIRAGAPFSLSASASASSLYAAPLTLDTSKLTAQLPSQNTAILGGGVVGALTPAVLTANALPVNATYAEAGYLYLAPGAFRDDTFTAVDRAAGDCISDTSGTNYLSDTLIGGKYGCSIGNLLPVSFGRFIPDHFDTAIDAGVPMPCPGALSCPAAGFVYAAQPFGVTVTARNLASATTRNYAGVFSHPVALQAWDGPGNAALLQNPPAIPLGSVLSGSAVAAASFLSGVADLNGAASPAYVFPFAWPAASSKLAAPTAIYVRALETGADGVTSARASASVEGGVTVVTGRLYLTNNFGSELLPLPILVTAQYWNGTRFTSSTSDNASTFNASDVVLGNCTGALNAGAGACIATLGVAAAPGTFVLVAGAARVRLDAPGAGHTGSVDVRIAPIAWLPSSTARMVLGVYKGGPVIYFRELY